MEFRRLLLRVMLWSLVAAAVCGVLAVLFSGQEVVWRIVGTMAITAVAAALMMWMSALSEKETTREAGLLGMAVIVAEWIGAIILIWELVDLLGGTWRWESRVGMTMFFGGTSAAWAILMLAMRKRPGLSLAAGVGLLLAAVASLIWMVGIWWPGDAPWRHPADNLLESSGALAVTSLLATTLLVDFSRRRWWVWGAIACTAAVWAAWTFAIWLEVHKSDGTTECLATAATVGALCNLLRLVKLKQQVVVTAAMALTMLTGTLVAALIILEKQNADVEMLARMAAASGIVTGCCLMALVVLVRLNRGDVRPAEIPTFTEITGICPLCHKKQSLKVGESKCSGCGLIFEIKVKEPRCLQCNYVLLMLQSDRCPECGAAV